MSWATQAEVLKHHRMLTKSEAYLRQAVLSIIVSTSFSLTLFISHIISCILFFSSSVFIFFYLFDTFCPYRRFQSLKIRAEKKVRETDKSSNDTPQSDGHFFVESAIKDNRTILLRFIFSREGFFTIELFISLTLSYILLRFLSSMPPWLVFSEMVAVNAGASFLLVTVYVSYIDSLDIDEFPTDWRDKFMLRFLKMFSYSRNYFFVGEVNGKKIGLPRMLRFLHTMIGAPTGEGKSSSLIIPPLLFDSDSIGSAVVPDAKSPELFNWVAGRWIKNGKRVFLFDPWHPDTIGINPLPDADDNDLLTIVDVIMREREEILKEDAFFKSRTKYLLFAILKLVQSFNDGYCNMASVYRIVQSVDTLKNFVDSAPDVIQKLFSDFDELNPETKVNALTSIREKMDVFMEADVRKAFSKSEFKLSLLFREKEPCLLILGCPIDKKEPGTKIASLLVNLIVNLAFRERRLQKQAIQRGEQSYTPNDLYLYLDELRNLKITALADLISIARETRTHVIDSVTDIMFFRYYKEDFSGLMGNHRTRIFMRGLDYDSAKYVSDSLGKHDVATYKYFRGLMASHEQRNLLDPDKVMNLPEDKLLIFSPKTRPFIADKVSIYKTRWLMKMKDDPPKRIRELYHNWGLAEEPLKDTQFPTVEGSDVYDFAKIKGNKTPEQLKTDITVDKMHRERLGKGVFSKEPQRDSDAEEATQIQRQVREDEEIGGISGGI